MAILKENEENTQSNQGQNAGTQTGNTGVQGPSSGGSRIATSSSGSPGVSQSSGRFTNLKKYVEANKGAGEQLGGRITSGLEKETAKATDNSQANQIAANVKAEQDRLAQGENFNARIKNDEARAIYGNADDKTQFQNLYNNVNNVSNLTDEMNTAQQNQIDAIRQAQGNVSNLGSEQGRFQLLQNTIRSPNYTRGQQRLDQLTLQAGNPQALAAAQKNLGQQIKTSANDLSKQYQDIGTNIGTASSKANEVSNMLKGTVGDVTGKLTEAQSKLATDTNTQNTERNAALERVLSGKALAGDFDLVGDIMSGGGLTQGMRTYNVLGGDNSNKYFQAGSTGLTGRDVINADDFARYEALRGLSGQGLDDFSQVGGGYTTTGLKGDLAGDIAAANDAFYKAINRYETAEGINDTTNDDRFMSSGRQISTATVGANMNDLLNFYESDKFGKNKAVTPIEVLASNRGIPTSKNLVLQDMNQYVLPEYSGIVGNQYFNNVYNSGQLGAAGTAAGNLWNDFINELQTEGYNNALGGGPVVTPPKK